MTGTLRARESKVESYFDLKMPVVPELHQWKSREPQILDVLSFRCSLGVRSPGIIRVHAGAVKPYRNAVLAIARFLNREEGYDFPPYSADHPGLESVGYLLTQRDTGYPVRTRAVGCALVDTMEWDVGTVRTLCWVWFHPYCRRRGWMRALWALLQAEQGDVLPQPPFSAGFRGFLESQDWTIEAWKARQNEKGGPP